MTEVYLVNGGPSAVLPQSRGPVALPGSGREEQRRARVPAVRQQRRDDFAAIRGGLDTVRQHFYGTSSGRLPNTRADATRRNRTLRGGPGDRVLTQLDLWIEREISRHLREHSPVFSGIIETWAAETIQTGFRLVPATGDADLDVMLQELLFGWDGDGGWLSECDARGLMHFWDLITLAEEMELTDGDHAMWFDADGNDGRGTIMLIEGDRILTPSGVKLAPGYLISNGIVCDGMGRPVSVFVANVAPEHAYCQVTDGEFYPLWNARRPGQSGIVLSVSLRRPTTSRRQPWLSTAVRGLDEIEDVFVAVRIQMRQAACRSTYTKIQDWNAYSEWLRAVYSGADAPTAAPVESLTHSPNPGDHTLLNPGEEMGMIESDLPGSNFDSFMNLQLTLQGLPLGMCLEETVRIFQKSFSASRMAVDGTRRRYQRRQPQIKRRKVTPALLFAVARLQALQLLPQDPRCTRLLCGFTGWPYMEPLKDAQASAVLVESRLRSRRTCATEIGDDYSMEIPLIQAEDALWGVTDSTRFQPTPVNDSSDGNSDGNTDSEDSP